MGARCVPSRISPTWRTSAPALCATSSRGSSPLESNVIQFSVFYFLKHLFNFQFSIFRFLLLGWKSMVPGLAKVHFAFRGSSKSWKSSGIRGSRNDPQTGPLSEAKKLQNPLNSLIFRASGLPIRHPILDPFLGPDHHFLKEILTDLIII